MKTIALGFAAILAVTAFAIDLPVSKGRGKLVRIVANGKLVAELRVLESESIKLDPQIISVALDPKTGDNTYLASGGVTLNVMAGGKSVLTMTAERMQVEELQGETPVQKSKVALGVATGPQPSSANVTFDRLGRALRDRG